MVGVSPGVLLRSFLLGFPPLPLPPLPLPRRGPRGLGGAPGGRGGGRRAPGGGLFSWAFPLGVALRRDIWGQPGEKFTHGPGEGGPGGMTPKETPDPGRNPRRKPREKPQIPGGNPLGQPRRKPQIPGENPRRNPLGQPRRKPQIPGWRFPLAHPAPPFPRGVGLGATGSIPLPGGARGKGLGATGSVNLIPLPGGKGATYM